MTQPLTIGFLLFPRLTQLDFTGPVRGAVAACPAPR